MSDPEVYKTCPSCGYSSLNEEEFAFDFLVCNKCFREENATCGTLDSKCSCYECYTYFKKDIERPLVISKIKENKEDYEKILKIIIQKKDCMMDERYKYKIFNTYPYSEWKKLSYDKDYYNECFEKIKNEYKYNDSPLICLIGLSTCIGRDKEKKEVYEVCYRFPNSTIKYEMLIDLKLQKIKIRGYGAEY